MQGALRSPNPGRAVVTVLVVLYAVLAAALALTAFADWQGRQGAAAAAGAQVSAQPAAALSEHTGSLQKLSFFGAHVSSVTGGGSSASASSAQVVEQVRQAVAEELANTSAALLQHAATLEQQYSKLHADVSTLQDKLDRAFGQHATSGPADAADAAAQEGAKLAAVIRDDELHHIVTHGSVCDKQGASGLSLNLTADLVAPVVIMGHNRPGYMAKAMITLMKYWTADPTYATKFPLFISIDGDDQRTLLLARALHEATGAQVITRRRDGGPKCPAPDCHISQHYKLLLHLFLSCLKAPGLMFLEEDLEVAPDFFSYFEAVTPLMARDDTLLCVSAWADHGQRGRTKDSSALYRTNVMPGLGWYVSAKVGLELLPAWPQTNWDDWMRLRSVHKGRSCIYPEVSRTYTFGRVGTHMGEGFDTHHSVMQLNREPVDWKAQDLCYLLAPNYTDLLNSWMDAAEVWNGTLLELQAYCAINQTDDAAHPQDLVYRYPAGQAGFEEAAKHLKPMMGDVREGQPRASFDGHVVVRCRGRRLFLRACSTEEGRCGEVQGQETVSSGM